MLHALRRPLTLSLSALLLAASLSLAPAAPAQDKPDKDKDAPVFSEYKGVKIGMTADEARKKLGSPTDKGDTQDFYAFNDNESCQVFYDGEKKVHAVSVTYLGGNATPTAKAVLGSEIEAKQDGSMHRLVRYPKAGFWVSYTRTSGDSPMTVIAMQRLQ